MKKNWPGNWAGLFTKTNLSLVLYGIFTCKERERGDVLFKISFEFK